MRGATVATTSSRALLQGCQKLGLDCQALLTAAGLSEAEVNDPDARLPGEAVAALWQAAFERSADPDLGLRIALAVPFGAYRVIDFLAASAATVGEGLLKVARYFPLINSALRWEISDHEGNRQVALTHERLASALPRPYAEYALTVTVLHCRRASGFDWPLREVWFAFEAPEAGREHALALGCPVVFGKPKNAFLMAPATWDLPSQAASSALLSTLEAHAERMLTSLGSEQPLAQKVARLLVEELESGDATLANIARRVAMSPRTLQRRLELEQTSFAAVLDQTRRHFAEVYMKDRNLGLSEVGYLLGFSEQSAFSRAFQRWYGVAPSQYRTRQLEPSRCL